MVFRFGTATLRFQSGRGCSMGSHDLKHEVKAVLEKAAHAADETGGSLLDRTDFQRLVARLKRTLARLDRANDQLEAENWDFSERLCRTHAMPGQFTDNNALTSAASSAPLA